MEPLYAIVIAAQRGNLAALAQLIAHIRGEAFRLAYQQLMDWHLAEDATQNALTDVCESLHDLRVPEAFPMWLRRIVENNCYQLVRRELRAPYSLGVDIELQAHRCDPGAEFTRRETQRYVRHVIDSLPHHQRVVATLFSVDYSHKEIAALLGLKPSAVRKRLHDAKKRLRGQLGERGREHLHALSGVSLPGSDGADGLQDTSLQKISRATLLARIPVGEQPAGIAIDSQADRIYVVNEAVTRPTGSVSIIDGRSHAVVATVDVGFKPRAIAVNPATNRLYVTHYFARTVSVLDAATASRVATIPVPCNPIGVDVNPRTNRIYIAGMADAARGGLFAGVCVIDGAAHAVCGLVPIGRQDPSPSGPLCVKVNAAADTIYVGRNDPGLVAIIDGTRQQVVATLAMGTVLGIGVNERTNRVYATIHSGGVLAVIDGTSNAIVGIVSVDPHPIGVEVDAEAGLLYVGYGGTQHVSLVCAATHRVDSTVLLPVPPGCQIGSHGGVKIDPASHRVYVNSQTTGEVFVIEGRLDG